MEFELNKYDFIEFIRWPILKLSFESYEKFQKIVIPTAFSSVSLEHLINNKNQVFNLCQYYQINYEFFLLNIIIETLKCVYLLHYHKHAHRNIKPCNIIFSTIDQKFKLNHLEYTIKYTDLVDFYDIVGDDQFIPLEIKEFRSELELQFKPLKRLKQNLLTNDLYALKNSILLLLMKNNQAIKDIVELFSKVSNLSALYDLITFCENYQNSNLKFAMIYDQILNKFLTVKGTIVKQEQKWSLTYNLFLMLSNLLFQKDQLFSSREANEILELRGWGGQAAQQYYKCILNNKIQKIYAISALFNIWVIGDIDKAQELVFIISEDLEYIREMNIFSYIKLSFNIALFYININQNSSSLPIILELKDLYSQVGFDTSEKIYIYFMLSKLLEKLCKIFMDKNAILQIQKEYKEIQLKFEPLNYQLIIRMFHQLPQKVLNHKYLQIILSHINDKKKLTQLLKWFFQLFNWKKQQIYKLSCVQQNFFKQIIPELDFENFLLESGKSRDALNILNRLEKTGTAISLKKYSHKLDILNKLGMNNQAIRQVELMDKVFFEKNKNLEIIYSNLASSFYFSNQFNPLISCLKQLNSNDQNNYFYQNLYYQYLINRQKKLPFFSIQKFKEKKFPNNFLSFYDYIKVLRYQENYQLAIKECKTQNRFLLGYLGMKSYQTIIILIEISKNYLFLKKSTKAVQYFKAAQFLLYDLFTKIDFVKIASFTKEIINIDEENCPLFDYIKYYFILMIPKIWQKAFKIKPPKMSKQQINFQNQFYKRTNFLMNFMENQDDGFISDELIFDIFWKHKEQEENYKKYQLEFCNQVDDLNLIKSQLNNYILQLNCYL